MQPVAIQLGGLDAATQLKNWVAARPLFMGIDQSLSCTGVAVLRAGRLKTFKLKPVIQVPGARPGKTRQEALSGTARLAWFREQFHAIIQLYKPAVLGLEGYSFNSRDSHAHALGELGGLLRLVAHDCRLPIIVVPPNNVKQFATGKGQGAKDMVSKEAFKRWGIDVDDNNEADAAIIALMTQAASVPGQTLTIPQTKALEGIERFD